MFAGARALLWLIISWGLTFISMNAIAETLFIQDKPREERPVTIERMSEIWTQSLIAPIDIPRIEIYDEMQQPAMLKDFKGNVVIVAFWASWCLQCVEELETLGRLAKDLKYNEVDNVKILPLSVDFKTQEFQQELLKSNDITNLPYYSDRNKELMSNLGVHSLPTSFVIDPTGKIVVRVQQHLNWSDPAIYKELTQMAPIVVKQ